VLFTCDFLASRAPSAPYLSEEGIGINAARFGFYQTKDGRDFLSRTFTIAPEEAEKSSAKGKRTITNPAEMERRADDAGVGDLYRDCVRALAPCFENHGTNKTALWFSGASEDGPSRRIILSLVPGKSSKETGLRYQVYRDRLADYVHTSPEVILKHLPNNPEDYAMFPAAPDDLRGWAGYIRNAQEIHNIVGLFTGRQTRSPVIEVAKDKKELRKTCQSPMAATIFEDHRVLLAMDFAAMHRMKLEGF